MDRFTIKITNITGHNLQQIFTDITPIPRLTLELSQGGSYSDADFIIISTKDLPDLDNISKKLPTFGKIILLADNTMELSSLEQDFLLKFFAVITFDDPMISYRFNSLAKDINSLMEKELLDIQLETLIDSVPDLIWFKDTIGAHIRVNDCFCKTVNKTKEQIKYRGHCYIWDLDPEEYEQGEYVCMETEDVVIEEQGTHLFDEKVKISDSMRQLKTYKSALVGRRGETIGTVGLARDVTEIWNTHEEFKTIMNNMPYAMMIVDKNYQILEANEALYNKFIIDTKDFTALCSINNFGNKFFNDQLVFPDQLQEVVDKTTTINGDTIHFQINKSPIYDVFKELTAYFYTFRDMTMAHQYENMLKNLAEIDELTQIHNRKMIRRYFNENLTQLIQNKTTLSITMMDIDYFKDYNDHYGHIKGDSALMAMGDILRSVSHDKDILVCRYGGEEFMMVAINKSKEEMEAIIENIREKLKHLAIPHEKSRADKHITLSAGISHGNILSSENQISNIIQNADKALYKAKEQGRNTYIFGDSIN